MLVLLVLLVLFRESSDEEHVKLLALLKMVALLLFKMVALFEGQASVLAREGVAHVHPRSIEHCNEQPSFGKVLPSSQTS